MFVSRLTVRRCIAVLLALWTVPAIALDERFSIAQQAAAEGRYTEVVTTLSEVLDGENLPISDKVVALSNRGIAHSLLKNYDAAESDLLEANALDPGHLLTLNHLGILSEHIKADAVTAATWYEQAAVLGYAASQVNLGNLYRSGSGVERNATEAFRLYQLAAGQSYPAAYVALGEMYMDGEGIERDVSKGISLLQRGVEEGVVTGHYYLGVAYEKGRGVEQDYTRAANHYEQAARQGHARAQNALGYLFRRGNGVQKDFETAVKWYRLAAEQGDSEASNRLAWLLATCLIETVCNGPVALEFALLSTKETENASNLDTLAAAYARVGRFDEAISVIRQIVALDNLSESARNKYSRRLERYQNGIPFQL